MGISDINEALQGFTAAQYMDGLEGSNAPKSGTEGERVYDHPREN